MLAYMIVFIPAMLGLAIGTEISHAMRLRRERKRKAWRPSYECWSCGRTDAWERTYYQGYPDWPGWLCSACWNCFRNSQPTDGDQVA